MRLKHEQMKQEEELEDELRAQPALDCQKIQDAKATIPHERRARTVAAVLHESYCVYNAENVKLCKVFLNSNHSARFLVPIGSSSAPQEEIAAGLALKGWSRRADLNR